jgi:hypothetical protein
LTQSRRRLISAALFTLIGAVALAFALWKPHPSPWPALGALGAFGVAALFLILTAREDPDAVLLWLGGMNLASALVLGVYLFAAYEPGPNPKLAAALTLLVGLCALAWTLKRQRSPEDPDFPNVLASLALPSPVRETNRVQFSAVLHPGSETQPHRIEVYLQNTCSAKRSVTYQFRGPWLRKVRVPVPARVELGPVEVRRLSLAVVTGEKPGPTQVDLLLSVAGKGGRRIRLRRAFTSQVPALDPVGCVRLHLDPLPEAQWSADLPAPGIETLWQPRPGALVGAAEP